MIISNSKKFIFVHIMKAAGTTITQSLDTSVQWNDIVWGSTTYGEKIQGFYKERFNLHKHSRAAEIQTVVGREVWQEYFTFTFVRHPYDRAVSLYNWIRGMVESTGFRQYFPFRLVHKKPFWNYPGTKAYLKSKTFSDFIRNEELLNKAPGFKEQADWILDDKGKIAVDFIGKVENIKSDFGKIFKTININPLDLKVHNKSRAKKPTQYLKNESDFEYLYERFRNDFDLFGYDPNPS